MPLAALLGAERLVLRDRLRRWPDAPRALHLERVVVAPWHLAVGVAAYAQLLAVVVVHIEEALQPTQRLLAHQVLLVGRARRGRARARRPCPGQAAAAGGVLLEVARLASGLGAHPHTPLWQSKRGLAALARRAVVQLPRRVRRPLERAAAAAAVEELAVLLSPVRFHRPSATTGRNLELCLLLVLLRLRRRIDGRRALREKALRFCVELCDIIVILLDDPLAPPLLARL
mmetsp:Transcript_44279/g.143663  ORF Transcript_44279/g.143663 Transcript_44279/m.143663 type:complete len:230 (-) Transcript_44279:396-1085(-)